MPDAQGSGVGTALLAEAERVAREQLGAARMTMTGISTRDELLAWCGRRGYRSTGETVPFPAEHAVFLRPGIVAELETLEKRLDADDGVHNAEDPLRTLG